jgi:WD40 repeat protein
LFKININSQKILNNTIAYGAPYFSDITTVSTSLDGRFVATGTYTGSGRDMQHLINASLHIFDASNLSLLAAPLDGPMDGAIPKDGAIYGLDFSSDGKYLIAGHLDEDNSSVHIFDTKSLKLIDTAHSSGGVRALAVQRHGNLFAVASASHIIVFELKE